LLMTVIPPFDLTPHKFITIFFIDSIIVNNLNIYTYYYGDGDR